MVNNSQRPGISVLLLVLITTGLLVSCGGDSSPSVTTLPTTALSATSPSVPTPVTVIPVSATPVPPTASLAATPKVAVPTATLLPATVTVVIPTATIIPATTAATLPNERVYIVNQGSLDVSVVEPTTARTIATIPVGKGPHHAALSPDGLVLWVINTDDSTASIIDTAQLKIKATVKVGRSPHAVVFRPNGAEIWLANVADREIGVYNPTTGVKIGQVALPFNPAHLDFAPDGQLWAIQQLGPQVAIIEPDSRSIVRRVSVGDKLNLVAFAAGKAWLADEGTRPGVWAVDLATLTITNAVIAPIKPIQPVAVKVAGAEQVWVTDRGQDNLLILDATNGKLLDEVATNGVSFHAHLSRDGKNIYVTEEATNNLIVIDVATRQVKARIAVGRQPDDIAL